MNRLQKKCFIASAGLHLFLGLLLLLGPGFLSRPAAQVDIATITFVPDVLTDSPYSGGGNPRARPPAPAPQASAPAPLATVQPPPRAPEPTPPPAPPEDPEDQSLDVSAKPRKPQVSLTRVTRQPNPQADVRAQAEAEARERAKLAADAQRRANAIGQAVDRINSGVSGGTDVNEHFGPGGGGPTYASYVAWVKTVYDNAWVAPADSTLEDATVKASITIARDGRIVSSKLIQRSGDSQVDTSVQRALDRVSGTGIGKPFPEGARENERTYIIPFNLKSKRGTA